MRSFDLCSELVSLLDSVDVAEELDHQDCLDLVFYVLARNVVLLDHELLFLVLKSNLVVSLTLVIVQKTVSFSVQLLPFLDQNVLYQTTQSHLL